MEPEPTSEKAPQSVRAPSHTLSHELPLLPGDLSPFSPVPATMGSERLNSKPPPLRGDTQECRPHSSAPTPHTPPTAVTHLSLFLCQAYEESTETMCISILNTHYSFFNAFVKRRCVSMLLFPFPVHSSPLHRRLLIVCGLKARGHGTGADLRSEAGREAGAEIQWGGGPRWWSPPLPPGLAWNTPGRLRTSRGGETGLNPLPPHSATHQIPSMAASLQDGPRNPPLPPPPLCLLSLKEQG